MTRDHFVFEVHSEIRLTRPELKELLRCSREHYDHTCKALSQRGGLLYGWQWIFDDTLDDKPDATDTAAQKLSVRDLNLLVKVTENPTTELAMTLHLQLRGMFYEARDAYRKVNAHLISDDAEPTVAEKVRI